MVCFTAHEGFLCDGKPAVLTPPHTTGLFVSALLVQFAFSLFPKDQRRNINGSFKMFFLLHKCFRGSVILSEYVIQ